MDEFKEKKAFKEKILELGIEISPETPNNIRNAMIYRYKKIQALQKKIKSEEATILELSKLGIPNS